MTKTLTEQWRDGTLPDGYYYIDYDTQQRIFEIEDGCATYQGLPAETYFLNDVCLIKVLAPVPSYEEWQSYEKCADMLIDVNKKWGKTIKEIKRLQEQIKEANEMLKGAKHLTVKDSNDAVMFELVSPEINDYLKKWGVK